MDERIQNIRETYIETFKLNPIFISTEYLASTLTQFPTEFSPTCAVLGGFMAQGILFFMRNIEGFG
jgi:hypothetical protein